MIFNVIGWVKGLFKKPITVQFAPGALDDLELSKEEYDELVEELTRKANSGELFAESTPVERSWPDWLRKVWIKKSLYVTDRTVLIMKVRRPRA